MKELIEFDYEDAKGKKSHRVVWPLAGPSDKYFVVDLSEFDEREREYYTQALNDIHAIYLEEIKGLGLGSNYRYFKEEGISGLTRQTD